MNHIFFVLLFAISAFGCSTVTTPGTVTNGDSVATVSPQQAQEEVSKAYSQFIDVRTPEEFAAGHAARTRNIPLDKIEQNLDLMRRDEPVYLICRSGSRSAKAAEILKNAGFAKVFNVAGGTDAWQAAGLPMSSGAPSTNGSKLDEKTKAALLSALDDERKAEAEYAAVLTKFPGARPFVNIIEAERNHQAQLLPLFNKYSVAIPENKYDPAKMEVPAALADACKNGIKGENENIAMYDGFYEFVKEADIKDVFHRLQAASRDNHLPAFTRCAEGGRGGGPGRGRGRPF